MSTAPRQDIRLAAAHAALAVPGVAALQPALADRLTFAASRSRHESTTGIAASRETGGIRCEATEAGGWLVEVRCVLHSDRRIVDVARQVRDHVRAAVTAHLARHSTTEPLTVVVTVTSTV
ncbi:MULTISPECIES: hypothetical protein [unclassified Streptomyces]|uniref:hypothetical protein n=1 Tax=unclassified Streptomyces TaxID=2593676 RepID=UPI002E31F09A|nr:MULTISPECIES: hypothetical protein [unclassified Streptomyces]WUC68332.1 hypothetical protein OG861_31070 [Streptomyces sp. NBC_00539]